jgi:hypothetical protein
MPVAKRAEPVAPGVPLPERSSMVCRATTVTGGNGLAVAVARRLGGDHGVSAASAALRTPVTGDQRCSLRAIRCSEVSTP